MTLYLDRFSRTRWIEGIWNKIAKPISIYQCGELTAAFYEDDFARFRKLMEDFNEGTLEKLQLQVDIWINTSYISRPCDIIYNNKRLLSLYCILPSLPLADLDKLTNISPRIAPDIKWVSRFQFFKVPLDINTKGWDNKSSRDCNIEYLDYLQSNRGKCVDVVKWGEEIRHVQELIAHDVSSSNS